MAWMVIDDGKAWGPRFEKVLGSRGSGLTETMNEIFHNENVNREQTYVFYAITWYERSSQHNMGLHENNTA